MIFAREGGDVGLFITLVPKNCLDNVILFVCLTTLGTLIEFRLDSSLS